MKIGKTNIDTCPYCGATEFRYGYLGTKLCGASGFLDDQELAHCLVCSDCGGIAYSWVTNPRKYPKKIPERTY